MTTTPPNSPPSSPPTPAMPHVLSVLVPAYNEERTLSRVVATLLSTRLPVSLEVVLIDDGSTDRTPAIMDELAAQHPGVVRAVKHPRNRGKGAAIRTGISESRGTLLVVQDADLEYDPADLTRLLRPILDDKADVVFGSRFLTGESHRVLYFWHSLGNRLLTLASNVFSNLNLTDMEVGYKLFRRDVLSRIVLEEDRFGFEPEVTIKLSRLTGIRVYEVGISYSGRTYAEGKKIGWRDGVSALRCIVKYGLLR